MPAMGGVSRAGGDERGHRTRFRNALFQQLAVLSNMAVLLLYIMCCVAALVLKKRDVRSEGAAPFDFPGASIIPIAAVLVIVWILGHATRDEFIITGLALVIASGIYFLRALLARERA